MGSPDLADYNPPDAYPQNFDCAASEGWNALTPKRGRPSTLFLVSANGVVRNAYAYNVQASLAMDDLFKG